MPLNPPSDPGLSPGGPVRIAYLIMAHHRPESVIRLVRRLYAPDHGFFIHYDLRSSVAEFQRLAGELSRMQNVKLLRRHKCSWGDAGIVMGMLEGIREMAQTGYIYDYAIQLSGQDYPIKSDAQIRERLAATAGGSFMEATPWPIPDWEKGRTIERIQNYHIHVPVPPWARSLGWWPAWTHLTIPMKRKIPGGLHPYFGSAFWYLHRSCLKWVHEYVSQHPEYTRFFKPTLLADECFFQILLMNSPLASRVTPRTLTHIDWRPPWPGILTVADLPKLQQSDCLFARKFDPTVDSQVIDRLDSLIQPA